MIVMDLYRGEHFRCGEVGHMTVIPLMGKICYCGKKRMSGCVLQCSNFVRCGRRKVRKVL